MALRVLVAIRWPVGGIRTWCRYVYRKPQFDRYRLDVVMPAGHESDALVRDLAGSGLSAEVIQTRSSPIAFAAEVTQRIVSGRYSLLHSHGFSSAVMDVVPALARRVPHLVTIHETVLDHQYRDLRGRLMRRAVNATLGRVDCVHAVSFSSRDNLQQAFPGAGRCRLGLQVIANGIESAGFLAAQPDATRTRLGLKPDTILVGFFGRFMAPKGFRYLIDAMQLHQQRNGSVPDIAVLAVGGGGFKREEEQRVANLGLGTRFFFRDFMPDIAGTIKAVDVVAMPSLWEASGLLAMEALTAGVPLVVSDASGLREVTAGTPAKVVPMRDPDALLQGIIEMAAPRQRDIAQAFCHTAAERFDVAATRSRVAELYDQIVEGR